ncbi:Lipid droplet assembly factor 1 [Frankliniella fusca]|uniref:Lipid droplet assembly factor 1 n=1 Tax=Frankliniella fusca TaxID=407009 RepID=A0AAE1I3V9_9NEOP|nr:Lipid droplet assembly factor 1 [Frankliniella fusca]
MDSEAKFNEKLGRRTQFNMVSPAFCLTVESMDIGALDGEVQMNDRKESNQMKSKKHDRPRENESTFNRSIVKLLKRYFDTGMLWACHAINNLPELLSELRVQDLAIEIKTFIANHPLASVAATMIAIACGIPIFIFVAFAVITIFFTICGFIIIEGAVLAAGSFTLLLCLASMAVAFITMGFFGGLLYITYKQIERMLNKNVVSEESLQHFEAHLPQILASLKSLPHLNHNRVRNSHTTNGHTHVHSSK